MNGIFKKAAPAILSIAGVGSMVGSIIFAVKATPKAEKIISERQAEKDEPLTKKEVVKAVWKCYIPTAALGLSAIACIIFSNAISAKRVSAATAALAGLAGTYEAYKNKVKEKCGEKVHEEIMNEIIVENAEDAELYSPGFSGPISLDFDEPEEELLFYDEYSGRYFHSTIGRVIQAEYHLNRNFAISGGASLSDFYDFLGIEHSEATDNTGWTMESGISWIDFNHRKITTDDGLEVHSIEMIFAPEVYDDNGNPID